jgi:hypothetical protein
LIALARASATSGSSPSQVASIWSEEELIGWPQCDAEVVVGYLTDRGRAVLHLLDLTPSLE